MIGGRGADRLAWTVGITALLASGCSRNGGSPMEIITPPPKLDVAYVSPDGGDAAEGTEEAPFASLARALRTDRSKIVLLPGTFPEPQVVVSRAVRIEASALGQAILDGHLFISASEVSVAGVNVTGGVGVHLAHDVVISSATVAYGLKDDAVSVVSSEVRLVDLHLSCGPETCLQVTTSTVDVSNVVARADAGSKRVVRVESSRATVHRLMTFGGDITQLQASLHSNLRVTTATLAGSGGSGLAALQDSLLEASDVHVIAARRAGCLVQRARAQVTSSTFDAQTGQGVALSGAHLTLRSSTVTPARDGALQVAGYSGQPSRLELVGGVVQHGEHSGVLVSGGLVHVDGTRFEGAGEGTDVDAILATGLGNRVEVVRATFLRPPGFAVAVHQDALATVTATVIEPGLGGVLVDDVAVDKVFVTGMVVRGCRQGSGVVALQSPMVEVRGGRVEGCVEAGYLAGEGSGVVVRGARAVGNIQYGFAAFGGSSMSLEGVQASGSRWAAFAACGDGSRVVADAESVLEGATVLCP